MEERRGIFASSYPAQFKLAPFDIQNLQLIPQDIKRQYGFLFQNEPVRMGKRGQGEMQREELFFPKENKVIKTTDFTQDYNLINALREIQKKNIWTQKDLIEKYPDYFGLIIDPNVSDEQFAINAISKISFTLHELDKTSCQTPEPWIMLFYALNERYFQPILPDIKSNLKSWNCLAKIIDF